MSLTKAILLLWPCLSILLWTIESLPELGIHRNKSFRLRTTIEVRHLDMLNLRYQVEESYSWPQMRTKVEYQILSPTKEVWQQEAKIPAAGKLIVDDNTAAPVLIAAADDAAADRCRLVDLHDFWSSLKLDLVNSVTQSTDLNVGREIDIYGPSSVLFLLDEIKHQLKGMPQTIVSVRNIPAAMFQFPSKSTGIFVYYSKTRLGEAKELLPLRIDFDFLAGHQIQFDFQSFESGASLDAEQLLDSGADLKFDRLFIDRGLGCSKISQDTRSSHSNLLVSHLFANAQSFSFYAKFIPEQSGSQVLSQVAYHGPLDSMRIDRESSVRSLQVIVNFASGQTYQKLIQTRDDDRLLNDILTASPDANTDSCIVVRSPKRSKEATSERYNLPGLLAGSNRFLYLGLAQVRGQWTKAFEAYDTIWPHWLEQPVSYTRHWFHDDPNQEHVQEARLKPGQVLSVVVYLQLNEDTRGEAQAGDTQQADRDRLVHMEIFYIDMATQRQFGLLSISIYDFAWQVNKFGHLTKTSDIFSMEDECLAAPEAPNRSSRQSKLISMQLAGGALDAKGSGWLQNGHLRDLSLIECLQNQLELSSWLVHDLSSSYDSQMTGLGRDNRQLQMVNLDFRLALNGASAIQLHYYGQGNAKKLYRFRLKNLRAPSLRVCYYVAAHLTTSTFFGYNGRTSDCLIDQHVRPFELVARSTFKKPKAFDVYTNGPMAVYYVQQDGDGESQNLEAADSLISKLLKSVASSHAAVSNSQLSKKIQLTNPTRVESKASFIIRKFKIDNLDSRRLQAFKVNGALVSDTNKFTDFALVANGHESRLLVTKGGEQEGGGDTIDFDRCGMACLMDLECESYSFCSWAAKAQCVLTSVDFKLANLKLQLIDIIQNRRASGEPLARRKVHTLTISKRDTQELVEVREQPGCEIHNKLHLDLFHKSEGRLDLGSKPESFQVQLVEGGRDQCALKCSRQTLTAINKGQDFTQTIGANLEQMIANLERLSRDLEQTDIERISGLQRRASRNFCKEFFYLDASNLPMVPENLLPMFKVSGRGEPETSYGFCVTRHSHDQTNDTLEPQSQIEKKSAEAEASFLSLEHYSFKFEILYEKQQGLALKSSKKTSEELQAQNFLRSRKLMQSIKVDDLKALRNLIERHGNCQETIRMSHKDETLCATACALQTVGPWPSCKSFDLVVLSTGYNQSTTAVCRLNSITHAEVLASGRQDLVQQAGSQNVMLWHYEPKWHLFGTNRAPRENSLHSDDKTNATHSTSAAFVLALISFLGLISGLLIGFSIATTYTRRPSSNLLDDADQGDLCYDLTSLDFKRS